MVAMLFCVLYVTLYDSGCSPPKRTFPDWRKSYIDRTRRGATCYVTKEGARDESFVPSSIIKKVWSQSESCARRVEGTVATSWPCLGFDERKQKTNAQGDQFA
jgi:hypothetical protein